MRALRQFVSVWLQLSAIGQLAKIAFWAVKTWGNPVEKAGAKALSSAWAFWLNPSPETQKTMLADIQTAIAVDLVNMTPAPPIHKSPQVNDDLTGSEIAGNNAANRRQG